MRSLNAGLLYFACTFGAGFVLGPLRILFVVPRVGERVAELIEMPIMLAVTYFAARWVTRRLSIPAAAGPRLTTGLTALGLMLLAELTLVLRLRALTLDDYFATRDPVAAAAYYGALALLAVMPLVVNRHQSS